MSTLVLFFFSVHFFGAYVRYRTNSDLKNSEFPVILFTMCLVCKTGEKQSSTVHEKNIQVFETPDIFLHVLFSKNVQFSALFTLLASISI